MKGPDTNENPRPGNVLDEEMGRRRALQKLAGFLGGLAAGSTAVVAADSVLQKAQRGKCDEQWKGQLLQTDEKFADRVEGISALDRLRAQLYNPREKRLLDLLETDPNLRREFLGNVKDLVDGLVEATTERNRALWTIEKDKRSCDEWANGLF